MVMCTPYSDTRFSTNQAYSAANVNGFEVSLN